MTGGAPPVRLRVATLNILNLADRWEERLPLLLADMAAIQPDLLGLQEVVYPMQQDRLMAAAGKGEYVVLRGPAQRPEWGNSLLVKTPLVPAGPAERLGLAAGRAAHRVTVPLPGGPSLLVAVTHLHHVVADRAVRDGQAAELLRWLDTAPPATAQLVMGDFNAPPGEPACERMRAGGFRSAFTEATGAEPAVTWPSGLQAPAMDTDGEPGCLDYVWLRGAARAVSARLAWDRPAADDPTLYPSDHIGVLAEIEVG